MKKVLVLDRSYSINKMKSEVFEIICVALDANRKLQCEKQGLNVVACFEEDYNKLETAIVPLNYLIHSFDSDRFLVRYPYKKRLEVLGKEITFWRKVLDEQKPDLIVGECMTIEFMEVMYIEAQKRGILFKSWCPHRFNGKTFWVDKPFNSLMPQEYWDNTKVSDKNIKEAHLLIEDIRVRHKQPQYVMFKQPGKISLLGRYLRCLLGEIRKTLRKRKMGFFDYENYIRIDKGFVRNTIALFFHRYDKFYLKAESDYFFYPMHYEPETAVNYYGDCYDDQPMLIGRIAHSLGTGQILIVKEHPQQRGILLTRPYRELKKKYPNLIFVNGKELSYNIFEKCKCVITLNGTAGWEALICGKPVILFGDVFYASCSGANQCDGFKKLKDMIRKNSFLSPVAEDVELFVAKIFAHCKDMEMTSFEEDDILKITKEVENCLR